MIEYTSRYYELETAMWTSPDGRKYRYLQRRMIPLAEASGMLAEHMVVQGDRLDNVTARYLGDPQLFWQVCDANNAMHPEKLTETIGRTLSIPSPLGGTAP